MHSLTDDVHSLTDDVHSLTDDEIIGGVDFVRKCGQRFGAVQINQRQDGREEAQPEPPHQGSPTIHTQPDERKTPRNIVFAMIDFFFPVFFLKSVECKTRLQ